MLSFLAFAMVATFMTLIMTKRLSAIVALIVVPLLFALLAGAFAGVDLSTLGEMMMGGVADLAPTGVMLVFGILYFGLMIDVGLFDPLIAAIVKLVHGDPQRILIGTAVLSLMVSLDGDGTTTYMITTAAMLPLYKRMKLDMRMLACIVIMAGAVMNVLPWGGPTARVMSSLKLNSEQVFVPLIPAMAATALWVILVAWYFGRKERARLGRLSPEEIGAPIGDDLDIHCAVDPAKRRFFWFNLAMTVGLMAAMLSALLPLGILFMLAYAIAVTVNYPSVQAQREQLAAHAGNALSVAGLVFAAGIFMGILSGTQMVNAMSATVIAAVPPAWGPYMAPITAVISAPFTFFISNDAFYFGVLPILAETGAAYGVTAEQIGRASLVGQQVHLLSPLVASTYLLVGFVGIELGEHQRFTLKWALGSFFVFFITSLLFGIFPFSA
ncbi:CitMHS family transporter [Pelagerythrobacter aerophilus]